MSKVSIRFYNDHEVRAVWDEEQSKCFFLQLISLPQLLKVRMQESIGVY